MFEFFIALFGGSFWGAKLHSEKKQLKAYDKKYADSMAAYKSGLAKWESRVVDLNLENELSRRLQEEPEFYAATIQEMKDCFGDMFIDRIINGYRATDYSTTALRYLLAKRGKLRLGDAGSYGIGILGAQKDSTIDMRRWEKEVNFIKWIDLELQKNGVGTELKFRDGSTVPGVEKDLCEMQQYAGGALFWGNAAYSTYTQEIQPTAEEEKEESLRGMVGIFILIVMIIAIVTIVKLFI
jgi:hypothetical protein